MDKKHTLNRICSLRHALRLLKSIKLAVGLILVVALLSLIGILMPQIPATMVSVAGGADWWLANVANGKYGVYASVFNALGTIQYFPFRSGFWALVTILLLNISVCSISRVRILLLNSAKAAINQDAAFYQGGRLHAEFTSAKSGLETEVQIIMIMKKHHFFADFLRGRKRQLLGWRQESFSRDLAPWPFTLVCSYSSWGSS